jgi:hypothetical protein
LSELEGIFLEKFFLEPGNEGTIGSVSIDDDVLIEILGATSLSNLRERFARELLKISRLKALLAGDYPPFSGRSPDYLRILMFVCWMQTSKVREEDDTDFREMLGRHTDINFVSALMRGLNPMWEHLQAYLLKKHGIVLDLPAIQPHSQIGRTLRIAFPTLRDKNAFRRLRQMIGTAGLLDPVRLSRSVNTTRDLITETMPSFAYNFALFDRSWKRGGRDYIATTFWKAWYSFVAEYAAIEELVVARGDFGDHELFRISPSGERKALRRPEDACKFVPEPIAKAIRGGAVLMEDLGWGRARATSSLESNLILLHRKRLAECDETAIVSYDSVDAQWVLASFRSRPASDVSANPSKRAIGWRDGIRVGGAYLGRAPFTPILALPTGATGKVSLGGEELPMEAVHDGLAFASGNYSGTATAQAGGETHNLLLVPKALETPGDDRLGFDPFRDIGEDQFYRDTVPTSDAVLNPWSGRRIRTCDEMINIGEALYARTARGLPFVDALAIIRRGLQQSESGPREWDILRTFADAGWFDLTLVRNFPARKLLQRPNTVRCIGEETVAIDGPTPITLIERVEAAAESAGVVVETHDGVSQWSLPRLLVRTGDRSRQRDFIERIGFPEGSSNPRAEQKRGDRGDAHGYHVVARFDDQRGFFASCFNDDKPQALYRLERNEGKKPFLYRSVVMGKEAENFASPSIAILAHHARMRRQLFRYDGRVMVAVASRVSLPSSWAQWASGRTACNAGPALHDGRWVYAYPLGSEEVSLLSRLVSIERNDKHGSPWIDRFSASASNRGRFVFDSRTREIRRAHLAFGKRN